MSESQASGSASKNKVFKPRAGIIRKSRAEREAHAKEEAEKAATRAAAAAQIAGKTTPAAKSGTFKKRELPRENRENRDTAQGGATGVFGAGFGTRQSWKRAVVDGGRSEILDGQESVQAADTPVSQAHGKDVVGKRKLEASNPPAGNSTVLESRATKPASYGATFESDDEPEEHRRDIDRIWISSDEEVQEEQATTGKGKARASSEGKRFKLGTGLRPVRAPKIPVEEQDGEKGKRNDGKTAKSNRTVADDEDEHDEGDDMEVDRDQNAESVQSKQDITSSPELSRKTKPGRKLGTRAKENRLSAETVEERAERLRLSEDVEKLREEFLYHPELEHQQTEGRPNGKMFLLQFPPLVPFLIDQTSLASANQSGRLPKAPPGLAIKSDPDDPTSMLQPEVETDPSATSEPSRPQLEGMLTANEPIKLPPGRVGKLRLHKSGKVTLDWGGTDMEVRYGTEVDFLQDVVLVETPKDNEEEESGIVPAKDGVSYALGQVQKKMVVIPDWQKLYD